MIIDSSSSLSHVIRHRSFQSQHVGVSVHCIHRQCMQSSPSSFSDWIHVHYLSTGMFLTHSSQHCSGNFFLYICHYQLLSIDNGIIRILSIATEFQLIHPPTHNPPIYQEFRCSEPSTSPPNDAAPLYCLQTTCSLTNLHCICMLTHVM